ncbi:MAG: hypothetical protein ABL995_19825 [Bryobacteraceae bacterium]
MANFFPSQSADNGRQEALRRSEAKVSIISDFQSSAAGAFTQVTFDPGLQTPSDAAEEKLFVR